MNERYLLLVTVLVKWEHIFQLLIRQFNYEIPKEELKLKLSMYGEWDNEKDLIKDNNDDLIDLNFSYLAIAKSFKKEFQILFFSFNFNLLTRL